MIEFVQQIGTHQIAFFALAPALIAMVASVISTVFALRAKRRASIAIYRAHQSKSLQKMLEHINSVQGEEKYAELEQIRKTIEAELMSLSASDRELIRAGLRQTSKKGAERYAADVIHGAEAYHF